MFSSTRSLSAVSSLILAAAIALALILLSGSCGVKGPPMNPTGVWGPEGTPAAANSSAPSSTAGIPVPGIDSP